jgi:putative DNA primase/helicase
MNFEDFARAHGLMIRGVVAHKWIACPTTDHPHKMNGRYKFLGDVGWVQNWATMDKPSIWKTTENFQPSAQFKKEKMNHERERAELQEKAAAKAGWIMHQTEIKKHPYLAKKGFPDEVMAVWDSEDGSKLVIPMRREGKIVGCQLISEEGDKKFLYGQATKGASFVMDAKGLPIFCEGFATGLSIQAVMRANKMRYCVYVCFSAGNMKTIASGFANGVVVADNDASNTGQRIAQEIGKPYWISPTVGQDFNDYFIEHGVFKASQSLKKALIEANSFHEPRVQP